LGSRKKIRAERVASLGLVFLLISMVVVAEDETSQKPEDWDQRLEMFRSVPYIAFSETTVDKSDSGVVLYNSEEAFSGYNLYSSKSLNKTILMDMEGRVVHEWMYSPTGNRGPYHGALMLEDGDLLVIIRDQELVRLNWSSQVIWKKQLATHHDVAQASDGSIYVIVREPRNYRGIQVNFDAIVHLTPEGEEMDRWSTYEHLAEIKSFLNSKSFMDIILDRAPAGHLQKRGDSLFFQPSPHDPDLSYFHTNTVSLLPATVLGKRDARFRRGNLLVCFRNVNQIAVLERNTYRVLWAWGEGELEWPHHPTVLPNGHLLIFDNGVRRLYSRVVELDAVSGAVVWEYKAEPARRFYSHVGGSAQRLPNGNTLICNHDQGQAFEVTGEGELVWMWRNPVTQAKERKKPVKLAKWANQGRWVHPETVYRMARLPSDQVDKLLKKMGPERSGGGEPSKILPMSE
jgi:outer membrane protein assembly factor BamB